MNRYEFIAFWTMCWLAFILGLCTVFQSACPLWLLILWFIGLSE